MALPSSLNELTFICHWICWITSSSLLTFKQWKRQCSRFYLNKNLALNKKKKWPKSHCAHNHIEKLKFLTRERNKQFDPKLKSKPCYCFSSRVGPIHAAKTASYARLHTPPPHVMQVSGRLDVMSKNKSCEASWLCIACYECGLPPS